MTQPNLLDLSRRDVLLPTDTHVTAPTEVRRLSGQIARILAALETRPHSARELAQYSLNYRARISDLRKHGYVIRCDEDQTSGQSWYRLEARA